jgi:DNA-directed RNA polymerase alpha subunit
MPLAEAPLSTRLCNCLMRTKFAGLGEVVVESEARLTAIRDFGPGSLEELKRLLQAFGLRLEMKEADFQRSYGV